MLYHMLKLCSDYIDYSVCSVLILVSEILNPEADTFNMYQDASSREITLPILFLPPFSVGQLSKERVCSHRSKLLPLRVGSTFKGKNLLPMSK